MQRQVYKGATSNSEYVVLVDSTTFLPKTGIAFGPVTASYVRAGAARVAITTSALAAANSAFSAGGWFEVDATNCPGLYRLDVPDAAFATGANQVSVAVKATGCRTELLTFPLVNVNDQIAVGATPMTEGYAADGAAFTLEQALYEICQALTDFAISGTTLTVRKRDGSTTAASFTLNDASSPTSRTRTA